VSKSVIKCDIVQPDLSKEPLSRSVASAIRVEKNSCHERQIGIAKSNTSTCQFYPILCCQPIYLHYLS